MQDDIAPAEYLSRLAGSAPGPLDIAEAALSFSALDHPEQDRAPYRAHLAEIGKRAKSETAFARDAESIGRSLTNVLTGYYGYEGDRWHYEDPQNADFMAVIDRRRGLPVALGILYIHAARAAGYAAEGLYAPGHFLLVAKVEGGQALIDPFHGRVLTDRDPLGGPPAAGIPTLADDPDVFVSVSDVDVLLRLQFNIKLRAQNAGHDSRAAEITQRMLMIAPSRADLWFDLGRIRQSLGALSSARGAFESCIALAKPDDPLRAEASLALRDLKRQLN